MKGRSILRVRPVPVDYNINIEDGRLQVVASAIDAAGNGVMQLLDIGGNVLSSFQLARPCATVLAGILTFNGLSLIDPAASGNGTAVGARVDDGIGTVIISGLTVGTGPTSDIVMSPTNVITAGQTIAVTAATITGN